MTRKILTALAGLLVAAGVSATSPIPWFNASSGGSGIGADALIWAIDATVADDITAANVKGPAVTVTRAGAGKTRIDSAGNIDVVSANTLLRDYVGNGTNFMVAGFNVEEGRTNLVLQSEDLNTTWTNAGTPTFSGGTTTLGDANLDTLGDDSAAALEGKLQTVTFTGNAVKVCSVVIKAGTSTSSVVQLHDATAVANRLFATVTWSGGLPVATMAAGTLEGYDRLASSSFRLRFVTTSVTAANTNSLRLYPASDAAGLVTLTGTVELGAMQCENADFSSSYIPTTTATVARAADVVTTATSGISGFNTETVAMYAEAYPSADTGTSERRIIQVTDGTANESIALFHRGSLGQLRVSVVDGGVAQWGVSSIGAVASFYKVAGAFQLNDFATSVNGAAVLTDTVGTMPTLSTISVGSSVAGGSALSAPIKVLRLYNRALSDSELEAITEPDPIWEWDAGQLSLTPIKGVGTPTLTRAGNTATRVNASGNIEVVNADLPRFTYSPTSTGQLLGLLVEEARTNLLLRSAEFDNASWTKTRSTISANAVVSPDGGTNADKVVEDASAATTHLVTQAVTATADVNYAVSFYLKAGEKSWARVQVLNGGNSFGGYFNIGAGAVGAATAAGTGASVANRITPAGNGWYRVESVGSVGSGATAISVQLFIAEANGDVTFDGDGASGFYVWGAQFENNVAFFTSYIPTAGSTATRAADVITLATASIPGFSASTLTMYAEAYGSADPSTTDRRVMALSDGTVNERFIITHRGSDNGSRVLVTDGGVAQWGTVSFGLTSEGAAYKTAVAAAADDFAGTVNAAAVTTDASGTLPAMTTLNIGSSELSASQICAPLLKLRLYNYRAPDARLQRLTTSMLEPAANDPLYEIRMVA